MAEVVGVIASVVTLGELATKVAKLKNIWNTIRNAPGCIQSQLDELEALNILIREVEMEAEAEQYALRDTPTGAVSLRYCKNAFKELEDLIQKLQRNIQSPGRLRRTAAKVGVVLNQKSILDAQRQLSKAFQMLQFAVTLHMWSQSKRIPERTALAFVARPHDTNTDKAKLSPAPRKTASASVVSVSPEQTTLRWLPGSVFGGMTSTRCSQVVREGHDDEEVQTARARIRFPSWIAQAAWDILAYKSLRGFTWKLTCWNVVSGDSPILEAASRGSFTEVMALISSGSASLYDRDDNGKTLLHYAVYFRNFDTAINLIKMGYPVMETDNLGLLPCTAPSRSPQAGTTKSLELLSMVISRGDFGDLLGGLIDEPSTVVVFKPSQFDRLIWVIPEFLALMDSELLWNFGQLPLLSKFRTFSWSLVRADTLSCILSRYSIALKDLRQTLDYSFGHSLHEFTARYLLQPNFRKVLSHSWHASLYDGDYNSDTAVKNAQLWKGFALGLVSGMEIDHVVKEQQVCLTRMTPLLYGVMKTMSQLALRPGAGLWLQWQDTINDNVRSLVGDVSRGGINLEEYGRVEFSLFMDNYFARTTRCRALMGYNHGVVEGPYLVSIKYGPGPEDWEFFWDNVVEEFAGDFWAMMEKQPLKMPGAWVD